MLLNGSSMTGTASVSIPNVVTTCYQIDGSNFFQMFMVSGDTLDMNHKTKRPTTMKKE